MNSDKNATLRSRLTAVIEQFEPRPAFSCLFGSAARGEAGRLSDVDVG
ncbi:MAG: nucleotidyltransferase domain-containing protein, partial [Spirochaetaceae bacterium]